MRTSVWKATTAAALGLAVVLAIRPVWPRGGTPPAASAQPASTEAVPTEAFAAAQPPGPSRSDALAARLRASRSTADACEAIGELGRDPDATAAAAIVDASRARSHVDVRRCALAELRHVPGEVSLDRLIEASHDPEPTLRDVALESLAQRGDDLSRATVIAAARAGTPSEQMAALAALAHARVPGVASLVDEMLPTANSTQQTNLATALGSSGDPSCAGTLARLAASPVDTVRSAALAAAARLGGPAMAVIDVAFARSAKDAGEVLDVVADIDAPDVRSLLIRATDDPRPGIAAKALAQLSSFDGEDVRAAVVMHAGAKDPATATAAAQWLALRGDAEAVPSLVDAAQRQDDSAGDALGALAGLETDAAHDAILALASRPGVARARALHELAGTPRGAAEARELAERMMRDEGGSVAEAGLGVLSSDESPEATRALAEMAHGHGTLSREAVQALGGRHDEGAVLALVDLARDASGGETREMALAALGESKDPRAIRVLVDATADPAARDAALASLARTGGPDAERALATAAASSDPKARAAAAQALVGETAPSMLPKVRVLARDPDTDVSNPAFTALRSSDPDAALSLVKDGLQDRDAESRALAVDRAGQLDAEVARPLLIQALHDPEASVVTAAASALASTGGSDAQQALLDVLTASSSTDEARHAAAQALDSMGGAASRDHGDVIQRWLSAGDDAPNGDDESGEP